MHKGWSVLAVTGVLAVFLVGCDGGGSAGGAASIGKVGVILPDTKSSARWASADQKYLGEALRAAGVEADIQNAQGDKTQFQNIAETMINRGVAVLIIVNLDSGTGRNVLEKARAAGIATIDYDRLTLNGRADYHVSFDNVQVGKLQGEGLVKCLQEKNIQRPVVSFLHGSPTDNNATLFQQGYDSVLDPRFSSGEFVKGPEDSVPDWDNGKGGLLFEQQLTRNTGINGVLAANDGLGNAAITVLRKNKLNGQVPVAGQDATVQGLQNILTGDQCMTVYKAIKSEATAAAELAIALVKREVPTTATQTVIDPESKTAVKSILLTPHPITRATVKDVVAAGFVAKEELCTADFAEACAAAGIS